MAEQRRSGGTLALIVLAVLTLAVVGFLLLRPSGTPTPTDADTSVRSHTYAADTRVSISVYGDSVSAGDSVAFDGQLLGVTSWVSHLDKSEIRLAGGSAARGRRTDMLPEMIVTGLKTDVNVMALGTNDLRTRGWNDDPGAIADDVIANIAEASKGLSKPSGDLLVVAVGPMDDRPVDALEEFDRGMRSGAREHSWRYIDPWATLTAKDQRWRWKKDLTSDGLHPNEKGAKLLGKALEKEILKAAD